MEEFENQMNFADWKLNALFAIVEEANDAPMELAEGFKAMVDSVIDYSLAAGWTSANAVIPMGSSALVGSAGLDESGGLIESAVVIISVGLVAKADIVIFLD